MEKEKISYEIKMEEMNKIIQHLNKELATSTCDRTKIQQINDSKTEIQIQTESVILNEQNQNIKRLATISNSENIESQNLQSKIFNLQKQLAQANVKLNEEIHKNNIGNIKYNELTEKFQLCDSKINEMTKKIRSSNNSTEDLRCKFTTLQVQHKKILQQFQDSENKCKTLEKELSLKTDEHKSNLDELRQVIKRNKLLIEKTNNLDKELENSHKKLEEKEQKLNIQRNLNKKLELKSEEIKRQIELLSSIKQKCIELEKQNLELVKKVHSLQLEKSLIQREGISHYPIESKYDN